MSFRSKAGWRGAGVVAAVLTLSILAVACGSSSSTKNATTAVQASQTWTGNLPANEGTPHNGGALVWGLEAESDSFSPVTGRWAMSGHMVGSAIFDPLATIDANGKTVPYLAKSFSSTPDYKTWTITLHDGVKFQDGTDFNADSVVQNIDTYKAALITGKALGTVQTVTKTGPLTVQVVLSQPWATFPDVFLGQAGDMVAAATLADPHGGEHPIGTGPFKFKEWVTNDHVTVVKNPNYWQKGLPHLDQITFKPIPAAADRLAALEDGTIDATNMVTAQQIRQIRANKSLLRLEYNRGEEMNIPLNTQQVPFNNIHARMAVAYATNQPEILKLGAGIYAPANGMFAPGQLGYTKDSGYPTYDLTKAKAEVAEYTKETGQPLNIELNGVSEVAYASQEQLLKSMWEAAGAHVTLDSQDQATQVINVVLGKYQAADFRLFGQPDPDADFYFWTENSVGHGSDVSINMPRYANAQTEAALLAGRATTDPVKRNAAYQQLERAINSQVPYVWLARTDWVIASTPRVHGYKAAGNGSIANLGLKTWIKDLWVSQ